MPAMELAYRTANAVLWNANGYDDYGQPSIASPIQIKVRWNAKKHEALDPKGNTVQLDATVVVDLKIKIGFLMWLGTLGEWQATTPTKDVMQVMTYKETKDLKNKATRRTLGLMRSKDVLSALAGPPPNTNQLTYPKGCYAIWDINSSPLSVEMIVDYGLVGLFMTIDWNAVESTQNIYDWTNIDLRLAEAEANGFKVSLILNTGIARVPAYVIAGSRTINIVNTNASDPTYLQTFTCPLFWDGYYTARRAAFIKAAGYRYSGNPNIIATNATVAGFLYDDWSVPKFIGTIDGTDYDQVQQWLDVDWSTSQMVSQASALIDVVAAAWPNQNIKCPFHSTHSRLDGTQWKLAIDVLAYGVANYPTRFYPEYHGWTNFSPVPTDSAVTGATPNLFNYLYKILSQYSPQIGIQMTTAADLGDTNDCQLNRGVTPCLPVPTLHDTLALALLYGPTYLEVWRDDGIAPALYQTLADANTALQS